MPVNTTNMHSARCKAIRRKFAKWIVEYLDVNGLFAYEAAEKFQVNRSNISSMVTGKISYVTIDKFLQMFVNAGIDVSVTLCGVDKFKVTDVDKLRTYLAMIIHNHVIINKLTQAKAAKQFGICQSRVCSITNGKLDLFSIDKFITILEKIGYLVGFEVGSLKITGPEKNK